MLRYDIGDKLLKNVDIYQNRKDQKLTTSNQHFLDTCFLYSDNPNCIIVKILIVSLVTNSSKNQNKIKQIFLYFFQLPNREENCNHYSSLSFQWLFKIHFTTILLFVAMPKEMLLSNGFKVNNINKVAI